MTISKEELEIILIDFLKDKVLCTETPLIEWKSEDATNDHNIYEVDLDDVWVEIDLRTRNKGQAEAG